jgi:AraC-like DNA-binding protein/quercetin dioxygenase-like cupin family protein
MVRVCGAFPENGYAWFHSHEKPLPEFPALTHVNEARCTAAHVLGAHSHPAWELVWFAAGRARWTCAGETLDLGPGDVHVARPGEVHSGRPDPRDPNHNLALGFDPALLPLTGAGAGPRIIAPAHDVGAAVAEAEVAVDAFGLDGTRVVRGVAGLLPLGQRMLAELDNLAEDPRRRALTVAMVQSLLVEIAVTVTRAAIDARASALDAPGARGPLRDDLRGLLEWIGKRLDAPPTVAEMAARIGLSPAHLTVVFRQQTGRTPVEHVTALRVERACALLDDRRRSITAIAMDLGFCSSQWFATVFRRHCGVSPSAWRAGKRATAARR